MGNCYRNDKEFFCCFFQIIYFDTKGGRAMEWKLTSEKYRQLLSFIGYGNFREADMIVLGNEEGTEMGV